MNAEPWITTTERLPYLVFPLGLPSDVSGETVAECLRAKAAHFHDVYNARAYSLSDDHSVIVCVRRRRDATECAIITFVNRPLPLGDAGSHDPICGLAYKGLEALNAMLDRGLGKEPLKLLRIDPQEVSRKVPN
jgi:hypothetical protein